MIRATYSSSRGTIRYVGAGLGEPDLLTVYGREVITQASVVFIDPDLPPQITDLIGSSHEIDFYDQSTKPHTGSGGLAVSALNLPINCVWRAGSLEQKAQIRSQEQEKKSLLTACPDVSLEQKTLAGQKISIHTALGGARAITRLVAHSALDGNNVVRLVSGDPFTSDHVLKEIQELYKAGITVEVIPGISPLTVIAGYAGMALGSAYAVANICTDVDWNVLSLNTRPFAFTATSSLLETAGYELIKRGWNPQTPVAITCNGGTYRQKTYEATLQTMAATAAGLSGRLTVTIQAWGYNRHMNNWWESRPLHGWNVLVPRTKEQAKNMSDRLRYYGAIAYEVPTIAIRPAKNPAKMEKAIKGLLDGKYQWIVFTSTNAIRAVWEKFEEFGLDSRALCGVKIACVGTTTAQKIHEKGIIPELVPTEEQSSQGLVDVFPHFAHCMDPGNTILLPRADIATETLAVGLRQKGWEIDDVTAYRTVRAAPPSAEVRKKVKTGGFDALCFTSSSTVKNLLALAGKPHPSTLIACIGPKTAETAIECGLRVDVQPEKADACAMVDALAELALRLRESGSLPVSKKKTHRTRSS